MVINQAKERGRQICKNFKIQNSESSLLSKINWIEVLLRTPLDDYRKTIVNLILAPYLINIRQLEYQAAFTYHQILVRAMRQLTTAMTSLLIL